MNGVETIYQRRGRWSVDERRLAMETREEPKEKREADADEETGDDGKVEGGVVATMNDVSGEAAKTEGEPGAEEKKRAKKNEERPEKE